MTRRTPASPSSTARRCSCSTSCPTTPTGAAGRRRRGPARRRGAAARRPGSGCGSATAGARWPRASVLAAGPAGCGCAVRPRLRGARARRRSSCWSRRCPRATAGRWPSTSPPSSGVDRIVPWTAARCVTRWREDRVAKGVAKWRSAARAASKQSRRPRLPEVTEPMTTREVCGAARRRRPRAGAARAGPPPAGGADDPGRRGTVAVVVGPEGGLTDGEVRGLPGRRRPRRPAGPRGAAHLDGRRRRAGRAVDAHPLALTFCPLMISLADRRVNCLTVDAEPGCPEVSQDGGGLPLGSRP